MRMLSTAATLVAVWILAPRPSVAQAKKIDLQTKDGRRGRQGRVAIPRRQDRRGRRQGPRRQAQQDLQHRAQGPGADFDDSKWEVIAPETLKNARVRRSGLLLLVPDQDHHPARGRGQAVFFQTTVDDYGEIWVDGKLPRTPGKGGEASSPASMPPTASSSKTPAGQGLPDRGLRHQWADLGDSIQLVVPQEHGPRHRGQALEVTHDPSRNEPRFRSVPQARRERSATSTTWAIGCSWSPPTASARSIGSCPMASPTRGAC